MLRAVRSDDHRSKISSCVKARSGLGVSAGAFFRHSIGSTGVTVLSITTGSGWSVREHPTTVSGKTDIAAIRKSRISFP